MIITGPNYVAIGDLITSLGIVQVEQWHTFELKNEDEL